MPSPPGPMDGALALLLALTALALSPVPALAAAASGDAEAMREVAKALGADRTLSWDLSGDPCGWARVSCDGSGRVKSIQVGGRGLSGTLSAAVRNLTALTRLELMENAISGSLPSFAGLSSLQSLLLHDNLFSALPADFFSGLSSLQTASLDRNPFAPAPLPDSLRDATALVNFTASATNVTGAVPEFLATAFPALTRLSLSYNLLEGPLPAAFATSSLRSLTLNSQRSGSRLSGGIAFVANMTSLQQLWLHSNSFSGPLPDFSRLATLEDLQLRDNSFTGPVPPSLASLPSLKTVTLTNNLLQGPVPEFAAGVSADVDPKGERFCRNVPGDCDPRVSLLLAVAGGFEYPVQLANSWKGNDPCGGGWTGITCAASGGDITVVNLRNIGLNGTISPEFANLAALKQLLLANNNISGTIPASLVELKSLTLLDLSNNALWGKLPHFGPDVKVIVTGNPDLGKDGPSPGAPNNDRSNASSNSTAGGGGSGGNSSASTGLIVGCVIAGICIAGLAGLAAYCYCKKRKRRRVIAKKPSNIVIHPRHSGSDGELMKMNAPTVLVYSSESEANDNITVPADNILAVERRNKMSIEALHKATDNFSEANILGCGGFGTVYLGVMDDGTKVAVKRMVPGVMGSKGTSEFKAEIDVLTKVRHRHLVSLLGYCWEGEEKLLVYEYMPQGTLSEHLFNFEKKGQMPMEWSRRLGVALDVARGVEYLHSMAHQSFIHRDLKPSNILLGDDMKAKVADFGLVRLAPGGCGVSVETRLAGTFGYLAPEYAATGRVTTKADVYSFGVILMELITGRKAVDGKLSEEDMHLVSWFRRMHISKQTPIDPNIGSNEETLKNIKTKVAELACHCCAREPYQRPDMGHAVNVLSSLAEQWSPAGPGFDDEYAINLNMSLPEALEKWQAYGGDSTQLDATRSTISASENTRTSRSTAAFTDSGW